MIDKVSTSGSESNTWRNFLFILVVGLCLGLIGGFFQVAVGSVLGAALLLTLYGAYNNVMSRNSGLMSGLIAGGIVGLVVGSVGFLLGGLPEDIAQAALFGLVRGMLIGAIIGLITRARPDDGDAASIALFLVGGSIVVGALLGAIVGLVAGFFLGIIKYDWWGVFVALALGTLVGGYLGSYFQTQRAILSGAIIFGISAGLSTFLQGTLQGLLIGMLGGASAPMFVVAAIGFTGGLTSRGFKAGLIEASEAPAEMIQQGAVAFLAPAMLIGIIVGAAATGEEGLIALTVVVAIIGMMMGVIMEIEKRQTSRVTIRRLIEMIMLGSGRWPIEEVVKRVSGKNWRTAVGGAVYGLLLGVAGAIVGILLGQQLAIWFETLM